MTRRVPLTLTLYFYPRPPRGGRLLVLDRGSPSPEFLSTPSARRATSAMERLYAQRPISIHALREEGDPDSPEQQKRGCQFLSTPSARRATGLYRE